MGPKPHPYLPDEDVPHQEALEETGFWGRSGAGCVVVARSTGRCLLALRSWRVLEPGTWATWGGAVPDGMSAEQAVMQELLEETGQADVERLVEAHVFEDRSCGFRYFNYVAVVADEFVPALNWENDGYRWVRPGEWPDPLHFGLAELLENVPDPTALLAGEIRRKP